MTKQEYEKIRKDVAKKYKDRIAELEIQNLRLSEMIIEERKERVELERQVVYYKSKLDSVPESLRAIITMCDRLV